jgi:hypothetical protein
MQNLHITFLVRFLLGKELIHKGLSCYFYQHHSLNFTTISTGLSSSFKPSAIVLQPASLREEMKQMIREMMGRYEDTEN